MIDWFVLLIPLVLLPIFLLFVFVGCVLDKDGKGPPGPISNDTTIHFVYEPGLDTDVHTILIKFTLGPEAQTSGATAPDKIVLSEDDVLPLGDSIPAGDIPLDSFGRFTCSGIIVQIKNESDNEVHTEAVSAYKAANEIGPTFTLKRDGSGGFDIETGDGNA